MSYLSEVNKAFLDFMCDSSLPAGILPYYSLRHRTHAYGLLNITPPDWKDNDSSDGKWTNEHFTQMQEIKLGEVDLDHPQESKEDSEIFLLGNSKGIYVPFSNREPFKGELRQQILLDKLKEKKQENPEMTLFDALYAICSEFINNKDRVLANIYYGTGQKEWPPFSKLQELPLYQIAWTNLFIAADTFLNRQEGNDEILRLTEPVKTYKAQLTGPEKLEKFGDEYHAFLASISTPLDTDKILIKQLSIHRKALEKIMQFPTLCTQDIFLKILYAPAEDRIKIKREVDQIIIDQTADVMAPMVLYINTTMENIFSQYKKDFNWIREKSIEDRHFYKVERALRKLDKTNTFLVNDWVNNAKAACAAMRHWLEIKRQEYHAPDFESLKKIAEDLSSWRFWQDEHQNTKTTILEMLPKLESLLNIVEAQLPRQMVLLEEKQEPLIHFTRESKL